MRNLFRSALVAVGLVIASAGAAHAQISTPIKFTTSFPFMVGHTSMPAGSYTLSPVEIDGSMMELSDGRHSVFVMTEKDAPKVAPRQDEVTFAKIGNTYTLREVWDASALTGAEAVAPHAERHSHDVRMR
jgi:hypothetical protein